MIKINKFITEIKRHRRLYFVCFIRQLVRFVAKKILVVPFIFCILIPLFILVNHVFKHENHIQYFSDDHINTNTYIRDYKLLLPIRKEKQNNSIFKSVIENKRIIHKSELNGINFVIMEYTKVFGSTKFCHLFNDTDNDYELPKRKVYLDECPYKNCIFTCNKTLVNDAQAMLFSSADLERLVENEKDYFQNVFSSVFDRKNQIWILWNDEANRVPRSLDEFEFNWTMSYRWDSEVSDCAYGCKYPKSGSQLAFKGFKRTIKSQFIFRNSTAVWFVSNCNPVYRIKFASKLKRYFPVRVFGECSKNVNSNPFGFIWKSLFSESCGRDSKCEYQELIQNKFYLSFESKNCTNYLTEKVWKMLHIGIIPVVIQPNKEFYELNLPPNSFIHAQDFDYDVKKLANYLKFVSNDFETYFGYLKWKIKYDVVYSAYQTERRRLCELCTKLNTEKSVIFYKNVSKFFNSKCMIN